MELLKQHDGWRLALENARVQMIQIDFRLSLLVSDGQDEAWVHIETPGVLRSGAKELLLTPEQTPTLAPILHLFNAEVTVIDIRKAGRLIIGFAGDGAIEVAPHDSYEAWQVAVQSERGGCLLVCAPGGEIAFFEEPVAARRNGARTFDLN
jgi:hypothetical protein